MADPLSCHNIKVAMSVSTIFENFVPAVLWLENIRNSYW